MKKKTIKIIDKMLKELLISINDISNEILDKKKYTKLGLTLKSKVFTIAMIRAILNKKDIFID